MNSEKDDIKSDNSALPKFAKYTTHPIVPTTIISHTPYPPIHWLKRPQTITQ